MPTTTESISKKKPIPWFIIIGVIMFIIIVLYSISIYFMHKNKTFFFKVYTPGPDVTTGLYQPNAELYTTPLTPEQEAKRLAMIKDAQDNLNSQIS
jgi:hypothetical protein